MKNLTKVLVMALLVGLFGVVAVSSLMATPSTVATPLTTIVFNGSYGIRWNTGLGAFEVFDAIGFSYIGTSEYQFNENGDRIASGGQATNTAVRYHIMQDIVYTENALMHGGFLSGTRYAVPSGAVVDGRGFTLKGFPIKDGAALFSANSGNIQNIKVLSPTYSSGSSVGIIALENSGIIESCTVSGTALDIQSDVSIAAIAYSGNGIIRSCSNNLNITTTSTYAGGIVGNYSGTITNCTNNAKLESASYAGGIAAYMTGGAVLSNNNYGEITSDHAGGIIGAKENTVQIKDNRNYGAITGETTSAGILGGPEYVGEATNIADNKNYGQLTSPNGETAEIYIMPYDGVLRGSGVKNDPYQAPKGSSYGIYYFANEDIFLITTAIGLSYIGNETMQFDNWGNTGTGDGFGTPTTSSKYYITKNMWWTEEFTPKEIATNGLVDGQGYNLKGFPLNSGSTLFTTINTGATVKNINVTTSSTDAGSANTGILCVTNKGLVENCTTNGTITSATGSVGGIAYTSSNGGTFIGCTNYVSITASGAGKYIGGIVAYIDGTGAIIDCNNDMQVTITSSALQQIGGIVGCALGSTTSFTHPYRNESTKQSRGIYLEGCVSDGDVESTGGGIGYGFGSTSAVGGLVGALQPASSDSQYAQLLIIDCNVGKDTECRLSVSGNYSHAGGAIGFMGVTYSVTARYGSGTRMYIIINIEGGTVIPSIVYSGSALGGSVVGCRQDGVREIRYEDPSIVEARVSANETFEYLEDYPYFGRIIEDILPAGAS